MLDKEGKDLMGSSEDTGREGTPGLCGRVDLQWSSRQI